MKAGRWFPSPVEFATLYDGERYNAAYTEINYTRTAEKSPARHRIDKGLFGASRARPIVEAPRSYPCSEIIHTPLRAR